jgi:Bacteriocin-protection, YdeI or OmpD-Associated/Domain of unknown function (DUF1905)
MRFRARIEQPDGYSTGAFFELRFDVKATFGKQRPPVVVTIGPVTYRSTVAVYGGRSFIPVREERRLKAGVSIGDEIEVTLELDTQSRVVALPEEYQTLLTAHARARAAWAALSPSHQREQLDWLTAAKQPETRARRQQKWLLALEARPERKPAKARSRIR